jgi:hypothetical protein
MERAKMKILLCTPVRNGGNTLYLLKDWMFKQRLTRFDGAHGWVHSGRIGTTYYRLNPGFSNQSSVVLLYAQMKVLAINVDLLEHFPKKLKGSLATLLDLDKKKAFTSLWEAKEIAETNKQFIQRIISQLRLLRSNLSSAPANNSDKDVIIDFVNHLFSTSSI